MSYIPHITILENNCAILLSPCISHICKFITIFNRMTVCGDAWTYESEVNLVLTGVRLRCRGWRTEGDVKEGKGGEGRSRSAYPTSTTLHRHCPISALQVQLSHPTRQLNSQCTVPIVIFLLNVILLPAFTCRLHMASEFNIHLLFIIRHTNYKTSLPLSVCPSECTLMLAFLDGFLPKLAQT